MKNRNKLHSFKTNKHLMLEENDKRRFTIFGQKGAVKIITTKTLRLQLRIKKQLSKKKSITSYLLSGVEHVEKNFGITDLDK